MRLQYAAVSLTLLSGFFAPAAEAADFTGLNIFGDSLVDTGNLFTVSGGQAPPTPPYAQRLSNGPIWIDLLAADLGLAPQLITQVSPLNPPTEGINYAFGGALSSNQNVTPGLPGLQTQVALFTQVSTLLPVDSNALHIIWAGGNDYNEAFFNPGTVPVPLPQLPDLVTTNLANAVNQLIGLGATQFLVPNLPNLGELPFTDNLNQPGITQILNQLSQAHNAALEQKLDLLRSPDVKITTLDVNSLFSKAKANPGDYGFTNVTESCLINFRPVFQYEGVCDNPDQYLFWDDVHPTRAAHQLVAGLAVETLNKAYPEPAKTPEPVTTAGLIAVGVVGAGSLKRRQQRAQAATSSQR